MSLREIHWEVTNQCNLRCKHCLLSSGSVRDKELTTSEAMAALESLQVAGVLQVNFTGGEPFCREDFLGILNRAVSLGLQVAVITNATLLRDETLKVIKCLGVELGVSLDGASEATNDVIRGHGSFRQTIETLSRCRKIGIPTKLYVTVTATNLHQVGALAELAKEYGCRSVHFNEITVAGRAASFVRELALSPDQKAYLPELVARVTSDVFGEEISEVDRGCWVDGTALYMSSDGELYVCSEVSQRCPDLSIGNIRSFSFQMFLSGKKSSEVRHKLDCCYRAFASEHVAFVGNSGLNCAFIPARQNIETLAQLYAALDTLYQDIELDCEECQDPDCMGYIWLLKEEASRLYELGVPLVQVNNGPTFIHSFPVTAHGQPNLSVRYPSCSQLCSDSRRCNIHSNRPLACHLYPLGPETTIGGLAVWALHRDCRYVRRLEEQGLLPWFEHQARSILNSLSPRLLGEIAETYRAVDAISVFPDGENKYHVLQELHHVEV